LAGGHIFGSQVSAAGSKARVTRIRLGFRKSAIRHLSSTQSSTHSGWQVAAPGGRWRVICPLSSIQSSVINSALHSVLNAALHSVLRDRFSPLSSVIDSVIPQLRVAGGSPRWQVAALPPCLIDSAICHPSSIQPSIQPYPASGHRWQPRVAGGASSALCHRFSHLSSIQPSIQPSVHSSPTKAD
jgi:hypothetical protein